MRTTAALVATTLLLAACGGDDPASPTVSAVVVTAPKQTIAVCESVQLTTTARDVNGVTIPGATVSYAQVADRIGAPKAVRAVAQACGANPVAVAIPCHRVVRRDGHISGYRWGVERKRALLEREAQA